MASNPLLCRFEVATLDGHNLIYTSGLLDSGKIPSSLHVYQTSNATDSFYPGAIAHHLGEKAAGTILSRSPLGLADGEVRDIEGQIKITDECVRFIDYCLDCNFSLSPVTTAEHKLCYTLQKEDDMASGCLGHVRFDFGSSGTEHWTNYFSHTGQPLTEDERLELSMVLEQLAIDGVTQDRDSMNEYCGDWLQEARIEDRSYGFKAATGKHSYYIRCNPTPGDYNMYCYMFDGRQLEQYMAMEPAKPQENAATYKLTVPLGAYYWRPDATDPSFSERADLFQAAIYNNRDVIKHYVDALNTGSPNGRMRMYTRDDSLKAKVEGFEIQCEIAGNKVCATSIVNTNSPLTSAEIKQLKGFWKNQLDRVLCNPEIGLTADMGRIYLKYDDNKVTMEELAEGQMIFHQPEQPSMQ